MSASSSPSHDSSSRGSKPDSRCQIPRRLRPSDPRSRPKKPEVSSSGSSDGSSSPSSSDHVRIAGFCLGFTARPREVCFCSEVTSTLRRFAIVCGSVSVLSIPRDLRRRRLAPLRRRRPRHEPRAGLGRGGSLVGDSARHRHALERERWWPIRGLAAVRRERDVRWGSRERDLRRHERGHRGSAPRRRRRCPMEAAGDHSAAASPAAGARTASRRPPFSTGPAAGCTRSAPTGCSTR